MDDTQFHVPFICISVISRHWQDGNERPFMTEKSSASIRIQNDHSKVTLSKGTVIVQTFAVY